MNTMTRFLPPPTTMAEAMEFAKLIANSTVCPKAYFGKPGDIMIAMQLGSEIGLNPLQSLQNIAVINGKPSIYGDAAMALVRASGLMEDCKEEFDGNTATCTCKRRGQETLIVSTFSMEDAKRAGLLGKQGPWTQYPARMLQMRARGFALRDGFADALAGLITVEEAQDYPTQETVKVAPVTLKETLQAKLEAPVIPNEDIDQLRSNLEDIACEGMDQLRAAWEALTPRQKEALGGVNEKERLKRVAESAAAAPI